MYRIRVNPDELRLSAQEIEEVSQGYLALADRSLRVGLDAPSYDGQFGPQVRAVGIEGSARLKALADRLSEQAQDLRRTADAFDGVDRASQQGMASWREQLLGLHQAGLRFMDELNLPWKTDGADLGDDSPPDWARWIPGLWFLWWLYCQLKGEDAPMAIVLTPTATPMPTSTPTPMPTPTATATPEAKYVVAGAGLWLRTNADTNSDRIRLLLLGSVIYVTGSGLQAGGYSWVPVRVEDGQTGWVASGDGNEEYLGGQAPPVPTEAGSVGELSDAARTIAPLRSTSTAGGNAFGEPEYDSNGVFKGLHPGADIHSGDLNVRANANGQAYLFQTWQDVDGRWHTEKFSPGSEQPNDSLDGFGNYVVLETRIRGESYYQIFAHLEGFDSSVTHGQDVSAGTVLGTMGCTGYCEGSHVHWEIRRGGVSIDANTLDLLGDYFPDNQEALDEGFVGPNEFAELLVHAENPVP